MLPLTSEIRPRPAIKRKSPCQPDKKNKRIDTKIGREVAMKILPAEPSFSLRQEKISKKLQQEQKISPKLTPKSVKGDFSPCKKRAVRDAPISREDLGDRFDELEGLDLTARVVIVANQNLFKMHFTGRNHQEQPRRVEEVEAALRQEKLMRVNNTLSPRRATLEEIFLCHSKRYVKEIGKQAARLDPQAVAPYIMPSWAPPNVFGDVNISQETYNTSLYAAGAPLTAIEYILEEQNETSRAFCIVRPPGHHAHEESGSGFCVFNNVAIAAKFLANKGFKVLIVDWDAHHGDGTQFLVQNNERIFYFSTHKDTANGFFPGPQWGHAEERGACEHRTVLNCPVSGKSEDCRLQIIEAFTTQLVPAMDEFCPDFVLISCGFDAHKDDKLVGLGLEDQDYGGLTQICVEIAKKYAKGRIVSVLEGGYNLKGVAGAIQSHVRGLADDVKNIIAR